MDLNFRTPPNRETLEVVAQRYPFVDVDLVMSFLSIMRGFADLLTGVDAHFARWGISPGKFSVMVRLQIRLEGMAPSELAEELGVTRATMTGLLDGLSKQGFVERVASPDDRRKQVVKLTPGGDTFLTSLMPDHFRRIQSLVRMFTPAEQQELIELMSKMGEAANILRNAKLPDDL